MRAAANGDRTVATLLLDAGADMNDGDRHGTTALTVATRNRRQEMIDFLLSRGAVPVRRTEDSGTDDAVPGP
jgi:ankyrin repeat protein